MKKKLLGLIGAGVAALGVAAVTSCEKQEKEADDVFHIYVWNTEFQEFFQKYFATAKGKFYYVNDKQVKFTQVPNDGGAYQQALDDALAANATAAPKDKVDMFLAEADYILKYTDSNVTKDVSKIGVTNFANCYDYTVSAASDSNKVVKGVSFQCCPSGMIYRRSLMKSVIGTDDPEKVQEAVKDWAAYAELAKKAKAKDIYVTASFAETYRAFSNNVEKAWVAADGTIQIDKQIEAWMDQAEDFVKNEYILKSCPGIWDGAKNEQMYKTGKTLTFFGPAWYYNFCMGNAQDAELGCYGDWAIVKGPMAHFWGGTWLLAATGGDSDAEVAATMNAFINDKAVCTSLVQYEGQFTNNKLVNAMFANDASYGNKFLGGQNDTAVFSKLAGDIKFLNPTNYDQLCNETIQEKYGEYLKSLAGNAGAEKVTREQAITNFKTTMKSKYSNLK